MDSTLSRLLQGACGLLVAALTAASPAPAPASLPTDHPPKVAFFGSSNNAGFGKSKNCISAAYDGTLGTSCPTTTAP